MLTLPDHFDCLRTNIKPNEERVQVAQDMPAQVRDFLQESEDIETVEPHSRLVGSYARHTALKDVKDVDIVLLISPDYADQSPADVIETLFRALYGLSDALGDSGEPAKRRHQRRSINIHLEKSDFDLDIVPAIAPDGLDNPLSIPDKDWDKWVPTHPLGYAECLSTLNGEHGEKIVPLIKLVKHWRDIHILQRNVRPKSYWLECMVYQRVADGTIATDGISYAQLFRDLLGSIYDDYLPIWDQEGKLPVIPDPMLKHNVVHKWSRNAFETFMRRVEEACTWADQALNQDRDNEAKAVELWQKVFGQEWFPDSVDQEMALSLRAASLSGSVFVTSTGRVSTKRPTGPYVQPPRQRFYGKD